MFTTKRSSRSTESAVDYRAHCLFCGKEALSDNMQRQQVFPVGNELKVTVQDSETAVCDDPNDDWT